MENDAIKWPENFSELQSMDSAFKCGICYDYMKTSMITLCSHTYCSMCIRKFLQYSSKCPTCFVDTYESDLRNNRPLDNILMLYLEVRNKLLRALRVAEAASRGSVSSPAVVSRQSVVSSPTVVSSQSSQVTVSTSAVTPRSGTKGLISAPSSDRTPAAKTRLFPLESPSRPVDEIPESLECKVPLMFTAPASSLTPKSKPPVDKAQCPVCQVEIPSRNINIHLDACLDRSSKPQDYGTEAKAKKRDPLPKRLYHMMNDRVLKQELKSHGLSVQGDRKQWLNRIRRFQVLYNSETDVENPRSVSALIQQLEREEREEKRKDNPLFKTLSQKVDRYSKPDVIAKANKQYIEDNKSSFQRLIEEMKCREGRTAKASKQNCLIESDEESDSIGLTGGTNWNPDLPSTSSEPVLEDRSKDSAVEISSDRVEAHPLNVSDREASPESPSRPRLLSESSVDSVFDFTPNRTQSCSKKLVKRSHRNKSRSQSPETNDSSAVSSHCLPDSDLYQSIFGDEKMDEESCKSGISVSDGLDIATAECSPVSVGLGESPPVAPGDLTAPKRSKRKQASVLQDHSQCLATQRPRRNVKKVKPSSM